jgi:hypothetical protein
MNREEQNAFLETTNSLAYRVNKRALKYPSTPQDTMDLITSPLQYHQTMHFDPLYSYTPSRESNGSSPGYSQLLKPIKLDMPQINLERLYGCLSPTFKTTSMNHSLRRNSNTTHLKSSPEKVQEDNSSALKMALINENGQSQSLTYPTFLSSNTKQYDALKRPMLKDSSSHCHIKIEDKKMTKVFNIPSASKHPISCVIPCRPKTISLSVKSLPKVSHALNIIHESNEDSKKNSSSKQVESYMNDINKDLSSLTCDGSVDNDQTIFDSDSVHTQSFNQATLEYSTPTCFSEKMKIFNSFPFEKKTIHSNGLSKPHSWNHFLSLSFQLSKNVPVFNSKRCSFEKDTLPWLPFNFPCQSISTNNGNFGLNTLNECYFSFIYENELKSDSAWNVKTNLSTTLYLYFFVEKRGKGKIRTQLCHVNQQGEISSTLAVTEWNNYQ